MCENAEQVEVPVGSEWSDMQGSTYKIVDEVKDVKSGNRLVKIQKQGCGSAFLRWDKVIPRMFDRIDKGEDESNNDDEL